MATDRFIMPNSADTSCELYFEGSKIEIKFFSSDGKNLGSKSFLIVSLKEDDIVNHLASADVNFTTFSALYEGAALILEKSKELKESGAGSDRKIVLRKKGDEEDKIEDSASKDTPTLPDSESGIQPLSFETKDMGKIIHHFEIPYAQNAYIYVFQITRLSYTLVVEKDGKEVFQGNLRKIPTENDIYPVLQESKLQELESMTIMFDVAEIIVKACNSANEYARNISDELKEKVELSRDLTAFREAQKVKAEAEAKKKEEEEEEKAKAKEKVKEEGSTEEAEKLDGEDKESSDEEEKIKVEDITGQFLLEFKVPYSESSVDFFLNDTELIVVFKKEGKEESRTNVSGVPSEDDAYELVDKSGITDSFTSMSLIYDVSEKIIEVATEPEKFLPKEESKEEEISSESTGEIDTSQTDDTIVEEVVEEEDESTAELRKIIDSGTFVTELKIPYSHESSLKIYWNEENNEFALQVWRGEKEVDLKGADNKLDEDGAWEIFNSSDIEFISMSVIYDAAEDIIKIVQDPESYIEKEVAEDIDDESFEGFDREKEKELPVDFDQFKKPDDIEPLLQAIKKSLAKATKPILVMEQTIKPMPKVGFKVFRQGEEGWQLDFYNVKSGKILTQRPAKLKGVTSEEIFKAVNNGIPQVTLSAVSDAAEFVFEVIKHLAERPADDLAFNQVVSHFEKIIDEHEGNNEIEEAIELTEGLMNKLEELGNPSGVSKFGLRLAKYFEGQDKIADSAKHRLDLIPKLIEMRDLQALRDFVDDSLELFTTTAKRPLDAAQISVDFAEVVLKRKDLTLAMKYIKEASSHYNEANISRALADHNFRFSKLYLQILRGDEPEGFFTESKQPVSESESDEDGTDTDSEVSDLVSDSDDPFADLGDDPFADLDDEDSSSSESSEEKAEDDGKEETAPEIIDEKLPNPIELFDIKEKSLQGLLDDTEELFKGTLSILDESNEHVEYLDNLTEIILLYRKYEFEQQEIVFGEMGVTALKDAKQPDRALKLSIQLMDKLIIKDGDIKKGLEFFNDAIRLYYEKQQWKEALDLGMKIIPKLITFGEAETSIEYIGFAQNIVDRVYPQPVEEALSYYLEISKFYANMKKSNESLAMLSKAISFKKNNIDDLLKFCNDYSLQYLEKKEWETAKEFINSSLNVIGTGDYPTIYKVAYQFFKNLSINENFQMANEYLTYAYQLTGQLPDPLNTAGLLIVDAIKHYLSIENADIKENIHPLLPILKAYFSQTKKFLEIKEILEPIVEKLLDKELWDEAVENARDLSVYLQYGKDNESAGNILHKVRDKVIGKVSKDIIREFTDNAVKLAVNDSPEGQQKGIDILDPIIEYLINNDEFSDAYLYTVQSVKFFETQKRTADANKFIKSKRTLFEAKERHQDVNSLTDLLIRLAKQSNSLEEAATISYEAFKTNYDNKLWEACYGYLTDSANTYYKLNQDGIKANELLNEGFEIFIKTPEAEEEADELINEIVKFRKAINEWDERQILELYKTSINSALEHNNIILLNKTITKTITLIKNNFPDIFYDEMTEIISKLIDAELFKESHPYVSDLILSYIHDMNYARDLLFYYVKSYIKGNEVEIAQKLVELVLEKSKTDSGNIIRITMRFVQMLAEYRLSGQARSYIDKIVSNLFPTASMNQTQSTAVATIYDKFSAMVVNASPELAIEYGYKAADLYRKVHNSDKFIEVYKLLASEIEEEETVRSILKRGTNQAEQMRIPFKKQTFLHVQLVYKAFETKAPNAGREFQQVLSQLEKEQMLKETHEYMQESFYRMVRSGEFDLFFKYIEYLITLSEGLKIETAGQKILVQLAARFYNKKRDKQKVKKLKQIYDSLTHESNPPDELLAHFLKTGELELPVVEPEPEKVVEVSEVLDEIKETVPLISSKDSDSIKEVEASATSLEDELLEIGGDELSQALANAISQLSSDSIIDEEVVEDNIEPEPEPEPEVETPSIVSNLSSTDLDSFDSIKDIGETKSDLDAEISQPTLDPSDQKSLENIFSSALSDLTSAFGMADLDGESKVSKESSSPPSSDIDSPTQSSKDIQRGDGSLTIEEEKIYLAINSEYSKVMKGKDFYSALEEWKNELPSLLKQYEITEGNWETISEKGDSDDKLSDYLADITR